MSGIHHRKIGPARLLLDFYTKSQTNVLGHVYYGKPITYRWIRSRIPECPSQPTLERYNRRLRKEGYIETHTVVNDGAAMGFTVRILAQTKFRNDPKGLSIQRVALLGAPVQMPRPATPQHRVGAAIREKKFPSGPVPSNVKTGAIRSDGEKDLSLRTNQNAHTSNTRAQTSRALTTSDQDWQERRAWRQQQKQRRILREKELLRAIYAGAQDPAALARRDQRLSELYQQLQQAGWQDERAG